MIELHVPKFESFDLYFAKKTDAGYWMPYISMLADRNSIQLDGKSAKAGFNGTYPVFVVGPYVFKFFGFRPTAQQVFESEKRAHQVLSQNQSILAPQVLYSGHLFEDSDSWFYTISTTVEGRSFLDSSLSYDQKKIMARDLGQEIKKVHKLDCNWAFDEEFWST